MSKNQKIILGVFTFAPLLLSVVLIVYSIDFAYEIIKNAEAGYEPEPSELFGQMLPIISFGAVVGLGTLILTIYYIINVSKSNVINQTNKIIWIIGLLLFNTITAIIYWYFYIWQDNKGEEDFLSVRTN